eukprot:gene158-262_t
MSQVDASQNLPREVLRWIQSLDLAYSVKNVKRDFSNGFLVAEIFSRYYAKEIQMHSYDNGNAIKAKRDNWNQLLKIFRKIGLPQLVTEEETDFILRCEDNAAILFITKVYEILTQRKVQTQVKKPTVGREAGYSKETGSWKVKETMRKLDLGENSDQLTTMRKVAAAMDEHEKSLQEERSLDPDRFSVVTSIGLRSTQISPKHMDDMETEAPRVRVKEIQVKQLDRNVTHLRASKQMQGGGGGGGGGNSSMASPTPRSQRSQPRAVSPSGSRTHDKIMLSSVAPSDRYQSQPGSLLAENAMSVINACISRVLGPANLPSWSADLEPYENFAAAVTLQKNGAELDAVLSDTLVEIRISSQQLAEACIVTPKQFWRISDLFCAVLVDSPYQSETYLAAIESFESIGKWIGQREPRSSLTMFCDFALPKLTGTLTTNPHKRLGLLRVMMSFSPQDPQNHVQAIKQLQRALPDLNVFITCLTIFAAHETEMNDSLLDLYQYYATIGLGLPSPKLRAGAMAVFASLLPQAVDLAIAMLPQFYTLATQETWWEVHAHLLGLCGSLMEIQAANEPATDSDNAEGTKTVDLIIDIVKTVFSPSSPRNLRHWGIVALAPGLSYGEPLTSLFVDVLVNEDQEDRQFFLGFNRQKNVRKIQLPSSTGMPFVLEPIVERWNPLAIASSVEQLVQRESLDGLEPAQLEILLACVRSACDVPGSEPLSGAWRRIYTSLKDYIFVGFCDQSSCVSATGIMKCFIEKSPMHEGILKENRFMGILRLLYPEDGSGSASCQRVVEDFLREIFSFGDVYSTVAIQVIEQFAKSFIVQFEMSNLQGLLKEFMSEV